MINYIDIDSCVCDSNTMFIRKDDNESFYFEIQEDGTKNALHVSIKDTKKIRDFLIKQLEVDREYIVKEEGFKE